MMSAEESLLETLQNECNEKDKLIDALKQQYKSLEMKYIALKQENEELKKKYTSCNPMDIGIDPTSKLAQIQSANVALKNQIKDITNIASLLSEEQELITNALDPIESKQNDEEKVVILNEEDEVEDIESTDDEIEMKQLMDDNERKELLKNLQNEFEHYRVNRYKQIQYNEQSIALILFHSFELQIIRDWNLLKTQYHQNMFDILCKNDEEDIEIVAYSILFDLIIASYNIMNKQYEKQKLDTNSKAIDLILLNIKELYDVVTMESNDEIYKDLKKYLNEMIDGVTDKVYQRYDNCLKNEKKIKMELTKFGIKCCEILWNIIYCGYQIYPLEMYFDDDDNMRYNASIHEKKEGNNGSDNIEFCIFPCLVLQGVIKSKMIVL